MVVYVFDKCRDEELGKLERVFKSFGVKEKRNILSGTEWVGESFGGYPITIRYSPLNQICPLTVIVEYKERNGKVSYINQSNKRFINFLEKLYQATGSTKIMDVVLNSVEMEFMKKLVPHRVEEMEVEERVSQF